ncbi:MAG: hypothetical protein NZ602_10395 [Thermoguttaceae bacterium]|nr:hypothetical protein [Thermoguttaceae bacterium]
MKEVVHGTRLLLLGVLSKSGGLGRFAHGDSVGRGDGLAFRSPRPTQATERPDRRLQSGLEHSADCLYWHDQGNQGGYGWAGVYFVFHIEGASDGGFAGPAKTWSTGGVSD